MRLRRMTLGVVLASIFVLVMAVSHFHFAEAKGRVIKITFQGNGLNTPVEVTEPSLLEPDAIATFPFALAEAPQGLAGYYEVIRYIATADSTSGLAFDHMRYYPGRKNNPGYVLYEGQFDAYTPYQGEWFAARPSDETIIRRYLAANSPQAPGADSIRWSLVGIAGLVLVSLCVMNLRRVPSRFPSTLRSFTGRYRRSKSNPPG